MKIRVLVIAALGLALGLYVIMFVGIGSVLSAAAAVGWGGFAILCLYGLALFVPLGSAWHILLPAELRSPWHFFVRARMVRDAAAEVLPFSQLGGILFGARAATLQGIAPPVAFGSLIVDITTEMLAQIAFIALGLSILIARVPQSDAAAALTKIVLIGAVAAAVAGGLFLALQRYGHRLTARLATKLMPRAVATAAAVGLTLDAIYRSRRRVGLSLALHFSAWVASAVGAWIAFRLIGVRIGLESVLAIESLVYAARSAAVFVPNALGVQEAAYAVLAPLFGVGAEFALAVSLLKRARDIAVGVPILLFWQAAEGRHALGARS